jgi:hypothetical protein
MSTWIVVEMLRSIRCSEKGQRQHCIAERIQAENYRHTPSLPIGFEFAQYLIIRLYELHLGLQEIRQLGHLLRLTILDHDHPGVGILLSFLTVKALKRQLYLKMAVQFRPIMTYYRA